MTTANALGWEHRIQHVSRQRLGAAVAALLEAFTGRPHAIERVNGNNNHRISYWVGRDRTAGPGRVRQECVLEALPALQTADRIAWQVTLMPLGERENPVVIGQAVWGPDLAPDPNEYHHSYLPQSDSAFGRPARYQRPAREQLRGAGWTDPVDLSGPQRDIVRAARQSGHTQTRAAREARDQLDLTDLAADDAAGVLLSAGAMRVVLRAAHPYHPMPGWVRERLRPFEHFHLLSPGNRVMVYRALGEVFRAGEREGRETADRLAGPVAEFLRTRVPLPLGAIESWLVERLVESGEFDATNRDDPEARAAAVSGLLTRANYDTRMGERLVYGIGCYNRASVREDRRRRFGSSSNPMNPCAEIILAPPQEDRLSRMAADARERAEAARDAEIERQLRAAAEQTADLVDLNLNDSTVNEVLRNGWREPVGPNVTMWPEFTDPALGTPHEPAVITAGSPMVIDNQGFVRLARPGEAHQFVAAGSVDPAGRVEVAGVNGSIMLMPTQPPTGPRRSAEVRVEEASDTAEWTESETPPDYQCAGAAGPETVERIRGLRANTIIVDEAADVDTDALATIAEAMAEAGLTPEQLQARTTPEVGGITRESIRAAVESVRREREQAGERARDNARQRVRQQELARDLKRTLSQMFDPDLDDTRMTGREVMLAHLRYRLKVLLTTVPVGRLTHSLEFEDDMAIDVVFRDPGQGHAEVMRVRMDTPDQLNGAGERIGSYEGVAATRAIDL